MGQGRGRLGLDLGGGSYSGAGKKRKAGRNEGKKWVLGKGEGTEMEVGLPCPMYFMHGFSFSNMYITCKMLSFFVF